MVTEFLSLWVAVSFVVGAIFGSFICCQVRRVIISEKLHGFRKFQQEGSRCEKCKKPLSWWEMIPVFSWLFLRGKCRTCNSRIGAIELFAELGLGLAFAVTTWTFLDRWASVSGLEAWQVISLFVFLVLSIGLLAIFVFDFLTGEMPVRSLYFAIACAVIFGAVDWANMLSSNTFTLAAPLLTVASVAVLSGFYFVLSVAPARHSLARKKREHLVGDGDWLVALPLAIVLAHPLLAVATLFLANIIGALIAIPFMVTKRWKSTTRIPFAPLLIIAFFIIFFARDFVFKMFMVI
ncbi:prepilin peptidase [Candidatus Saccharibacteria bacterium]|nr:prepilin peptidase [Candidatus Saccharibacteria bacterium]